ncbi:MAG: hypothetical protein P1U81_07460 [Verrucomicrobiales bacterium]|nr:hypothetical protein [Verrucomicrobiales bacterium]
MRNAPLFWIPLTSGILLIGISESASKQWHATAETAAERGLYQNAIFYSPPNLPDVSVQTLPIEESQVGYLTHDRGRRYAFFDRNNSCGMELLYLEYDGNSPRFFFDLFNHPPERCMASTGAEVTGRYPDTILTYHDQEFLMQRLQVQSPSTEETRYIFKLTWVHPDHPIRYGSAIHLKRIQAALATVPPPPSRLIMAGLYGFPSEEKAREQFEEWVIASLVPGPNQRL